MRPLIHHRDDERGAILVWVGLIMVVLIGVGTIVIDAGALYRERRELQNGADAGTLAVAQDCARGNCQDGSATADTYADANASDNAANVDEVCGSGPGLSACADPPASVGEADGYVKVSASTHNPDNTANDTQVRFVLAPLLNAARIGSTVHASAVAAWGPLAGASTVPLIFSECEFEELGGSIDPPTFPQDVETYISFHGTVAAGTCPAGPAGNDDPISGGFGWLDGSQDCRADIDAGGWVADKPGNAVVNGCDPATWRNVELLIPIYDGTDGLTGSNGSYHVAGFIGFRVTGYRFPGTHWPNNLGACPGQPGNSGTCLRGFFTRVTVSSGEFGGEPYGATVVKMIG